MTAVLAFPFRLSGSAVATVDDASDAGIAQDVAELVSTRRGERPLSPGWGVTDPTFDRLDVAEVNGALALYGPEGVVVGDLEVDWPTPTVQRARLAFTRDDEDPTP